MGLHMLGVLVLDSQFWSRIGLLMDWEIGSELADWQIEMDW